LSFCSFFFSTKKQKKKKSYLLTSVGSMTDVRFLLNVKGTGIDEFLIPGNRAAAKCSNVLFYQNKLFY